MKFVADENINVEVIERLRKDGHEVTAIVDLASGAQDTKVLSIAVKLKTVLITYDKDFGELVFLQKKALNGVLLVRLPQIRASLRAVIVSAAIKEHGSLLPGCFSVLCGNGLRIKST